MRAPEVLSLSRSLSLLLCCLFFLHRSHSVMECRWLPGCKMTHFSESQERSRMFFVFFLTSLPNYLCQLPVVWGYFIWRVYKMLVKIWFYEIIISLFFPHIRATVHPWTWPRQHCLKFKFVMLEAGRLAESHCVWTSLQSLAFQRGHQ